MRFSIYLPSVFHHAHIIKTTLVNTYFSRNQMTFFTLNNEGLHSFTIPTTVTTNDLKVLQRYCTAPRDTQKGGRRGETEVRQPSRNSGGGREPRRSTSRPTRLRRGRPSRTPRRQQAWTLVMGRRPEGVGPTYPTPPEPEHQQARPAGAVQPAATDACGAS